MISSFVLFWRKWDEESRGCADGNGQGRLGGMYNWCGTMMEMNMESCGRRASCNLAGGYGIGRE